MSVPVARETERAAPPTHLTPSRFVRQISKFMFPYWGRLLLIVLAMLMQAAFYILIPLAYKEVFDAAITTKDLDFLKKLLIALGAAFVVVTGADLFKSYLGAGLGMRVLNDVRLRMFNQLQDLSIGYYTRAQVGDLISRFTNDLNAIDRVVTSSLANVIQNAIIVVFSIGLLFYLEWHLALVTLAALPIVAVGPQIFGKKATVAGYERKQEEAAVTSLLQENIGAQKVIRIFGLRDTYLGRFSDQLAQLFSRGVRSSLFSAYVERTSGMAIIFVQLMVVGLGGYLVIEGFLTSGTLVGFVGLLINVGDSVTALTSSIPDLIQATAGMQRINELMDEEPDVVEAADARPLERLSNEIRFDNVTFSYTGEEKNLDALSFTIPKGQSVAFVGRSGSGKSTVLNLVTRFYDSGDGVVEIDGCDLKHATLDSVRSQMGAVFQDTFLFNTTVRENIRQGKLGATDEMVEEAARAAEIHDLVMELPQGYETNIGEAGGSLSGGQRQRISLARAILQNPSILILDEATSALDPSTEAAVNATLARLAKDRTVIAVTHRLSSVVGMDCIFVLEKGRLVEQGGHKELLNKKGTYYEMWNEFTLELTQDAIIGDMDDEF